MTNEQSLEMKKEKTISWEESRYYHSKPIPTPRYRGGGYEGE